MNCRPSHGGNKKRDDTHVSVANAEKSEEWFYLAASARLAVLRRAPWSEKRKPRRLRVDALEERTLLSVSPVNPTDMLVNQGTAAIQTTLAAQSVATDHNGDFVATWTRQEAMLNPDGTPVLDPASGYPMDGTNVYARYFTDQVQRITLPAGVLNGSGGSKYGEFSLVLGGSEDTAIEEVNQISFTQATPLVGRYVSGGADQRDVLAMVRREP